MFLDVDDRTRLLENDDFTLEPDTSTECELFDILELIVEETVVIVIDADPHLNIYVSAQFEVTKSEVYVGCRGRCQNEKNYAKFPHNFICISVRITTLKPHFFQHFTFIIFSIFYLRYSQSDIC